MGNSGVTVVYLGSNLGIKSWKCLDAPVPKTSRTFRFMTANLQNRGHSEQVFNEVHKIRCFTWHVFHGMGKHKRLTWQKTQWQIQNSYWSSTSRLLSHIFFKEIIIPRPETPETLRSPSQVLSTRLCQIEKQVHYNFSDERNHRK